MAGSQGAGVDTAVPAGWTQAWAGGPPRPVVAGARLDLGQGWRP